MITPSMLEDFRMWRENFPSPELEEWIAAMTEELERQDADRRS